MHPFDGATGLLARVGNTPLIRIDPLLRSAPFGPSIAPSVEVWAKAEWFNPGGSVKDRPALSIVLEAERDGRLKPGGTVLDASSGNTGIAYAMIAAQRGYRLVLCLPKNANAERQRLLAAYGATIEFTLPLEGSDGAIRRARELAAEHPDWVYLDQYNNDANWRAHFGSTGPEIWRDTEGLVTHFVATLGTTGTFTGTSRFLQAQGGVSCIAVQPDSPFHGLEGLKFLETAIVPGIWDAGIVDRHLGAPTEGSYAWVRHCSRNGLLLGPSCGAAVWAAAQVASELQDGVVVTVLPDGGSRYLSESHLWKESA